MIPTVEPCRFMTIAQIRQKVADDAFQYSSVRVVAKILSRSAHNYNSIVLEDPFDPSQTLQADSYLVKGKETQVGKIYEFLGEVEQIKKSTTVDANQINKNEEMNAAVGQEEEQ